jgi:hypothetical protein
MISYSALTSYGKATLPSVEAWNTNSDIVRDPPKGIHTRRIIKVGDDNDLLDMNEDSGIRINEMINIYARGNNPMVSVQYSNHGNTGSGIMGSTGGTVGSGLENIFGQGSNGKLPYRIIDKGAFRPPIMRQEDLLPLSRMPRSCTSAISKRCRVDQTKRVCPDVVEYFREVRRTPKSLGVDAYSQKSFKKEVPTEQPLNIGLSVNTPISFNVDTHEWGSKSKERGDHILPTTRNILDIKAETTLKKPGQPEWGRYIHSDPALSKNVPNYQAATVSNLNIRKNMNVYSDQIAMSRPRPNRAHSNIGFANNGTATKINQQKPIDHITLKSRGIH